MGGLLILVSSVGATLLWADLTQLYVWMVLFVPSASEFLALWTTISRFQNIRRRASAPI